MNELDFRARLQHLVEDLVEQGLTLEQAGQELEKLFIQATIRANEGNLGRSASALGVHRNTLRNKLRKLGVGPSDPSRS